MPYAGYSLFTLDGEELGVVRAPVRLLVVGLVHVALVLPGASSTGCSQPMRKSSADTHEVRAAPGRQVAELLDACLKAVVQRRAFRQRCIVQELRLDRELPNVSVRVSITRAA